MIERDPDPPRAPSNARQAEHGGSHKVIESNKQRVRHTVEAFSALFIYDRDYGLRTHASLLYTASGSTLYVHKRCTHTSRHDIEYRYTQVCVRLGSDATEPTYACYDGSTVPIRPAPAPVSLLCVTSTPAQLESRPPPSRLPLAGRPVLYICGCRAPTISH